MTALLTFLLFCTGTKLVLSSGIGPRERTSKSRWVPPRKYKRANLGRRRSEGRMDHCSCEMADVVKWAREKYTHLTRWQLGHEEAWIVCLLPIHPSFVKGVIFSWPSHLASSSSETSWKGRESTTRGGKELPRSVWLRSNKKSTLAKRRLLKWPTSEWSGSKGARSKCSRIRFVLSLCT